MPSKTSRPRLIAFMLAATLGVVISALWLIEPGDGGLAGPASRKAISRGPAAAALAPSMPGPSQARPLEKPLVAAGSITLVTSSLSDAAASPAPAQPKSPFDEVRQRMLAAHPDIAQFRQLQRKVLLKPGEKEMLRGIYKDRGLIEAAKRDLLAHGETVFTEEGQFNRLYRVEYLGMGLGWNENPERANLLNDIEELLLAKNINPGQDLELRRSLAGDKVELFMILLYNDRTRADALIHQVQGTDLEQLLAYARMRYDALWALAEK